MVSKQAKHEKPSYEQLLQRIGELDAQLQQIKANNDYVWKLFSETMRGLQLSSTSIKVAISSLLSHDIFWDPPNQHEFLETINESTNKITQLVALLTLAFRAEAGSLVLNPEPQVLQEILAIIHKKAKARFPDLKTDLLMSSSEKTVRIDFEYSIMAIMYLIDFMYQKDKLQPVLIKAEEKGGLWFVDLVGFSPIAVKQIHGLHSFVTQKYPVDQADIKPETVIGLHVACEILQLQQIQNDVIETRGQTGLRLIFPAHSANQ